jgi:hypothetical protein
MSPVPLKGDDTHELFPELFEPSEQCNAPKPPQKENDAARKPVRKRNANQHEKRSRLQIVLVGVQNGGEAVSPDGMPSPGQDDGDGRLMDARQVREPFVSAQEAAKFIGIGRRFLLDLARHGIIGAYPIGTGELRKNWVFRLSELAAAIDRRNAS